MIAVQKSDITQGLGGGSVAIVEFGQPLVTEIVEIDRALFAVCEGRPCERLPSIAIGTAISEGSRKSADPVS